MKTVKFGQYTVNTYDSAKEFVSDMMKHEGLKFMDDYGRWWKYERYEFYFKDLGEKEFKKGVHCLHLFGTSIGYETPQS